MKSWTVLHLVLIHLNPIMVRAWYLDFSENETLESYLGYLPLPEFLTADEIKDKSGVTLIKVCRFL